MSITLSIRIKAVFLILIFGFNTVVGFACGAGMDPAFNAGHHHDDNEVTEIHEHSGNKLGHHDEKQEHNDSNKNDTGGCCHDKVVKIAQADKAVAPVFKIFNPIFFTAFIAVYRNVDVVFSSQLNTSLKYFVHGHHPPIADIRIAIRSFQI